VRYIKLSQTQPVEEGSDYYEYGNSEHFWVIHRQRLLLRYFDNIIRQANVVGEIGCGNGLVLSFISKYYKKTIDGMDLNERALEMCPEFDGQLFYYDVLDRHPEMESKYDLLLLLDVLEHIDEEKPFLDAISWHLKPGGTVLINVPCNSRLFSRYDEAAGHFRRYDIHALYKVLESAGFSVLRHINWGYCYLPIILLRKIALQFLPKAQAYQTGFETGEITNQLFTLLGMLDFNTRWNFPGSSVLVEIEKPE
jgi:SAM-dependent methyltransferase